jgi:putative transposase
MQVFFSADDYRSYLSFLEHQARLHSLTVWAYCLMPNHVHLIAVPAVEAGLSKPVGEAHRRYALKVNKREGWTGHFWQERFNSFPMDEPHVKAAIRYVLLNPVRAGLVKTATDWPFSSVGCHVHGKLDRLVHRRPVEERVRDWNTFLRGDESSRDETDTLRRHGRIGRPLGSEEFIERLERVTGRRLRPRKAGRKPRRK